MPFPMLLTGSAILTGDIFAGDLVGVVFNSLLPSAPNKLSPLPLAFLSPSCSPSCPLGSTVTKLVRTFDRGLEVSEQVGERPRDGGEVELVFPSNIARRLRTPLLDRLSDMTAQ